MNDEIVAEYRKKYETLDEFRVALATLGERLQLNMSDNWQEMTADIFANRQDCLCQTRAVLCPCPAGIAEAKAGRECHCGLFVGH